MILDCNKQEKTVSLDIILMVIVARKTTLHPLAVWLYTKLWRLLFICPDTQQESHCTLLLSDPRNPIFYTF